MAWLNIGVQAALPLTLALATPSASAALGAKSAKETPASARLHTFAMGDTLASTAARYGTNVTALRTLNPHRDLDSLKPGDRLSVPTASALALPDLDSPAPDTAATAEDEQARKLATLASDTGSFLSSNPDGDAAASMARGLATGEASGQAQAWLSRFGTARVQIDVDDKLSLKNSQVELLVPLHDTPEQLLFTQGSVHRKDDRQQTSLGLGVRRFNDSYMLGANSFLDHDLSRGHSRLGLGVEYWRDFLKVNANSYQRLTGWKDSPDVEDYQERPANGWDIRTEAWLPSMPQLGGKLTYEQYYGDEVGLFGKDNRKKDPSAVTAGLTYTPIPLLTLSAEQRKGNGADETTFGAEFNYRLGEAWARQVDPAGVGAMRTLAGSRYDLVERNNHIVLEYRKKQVIQMAAAAHITGQAGETKSLSVWVNSKHPLSHIDWTSPALLQAGGQLVHDGGPNYSVVLPEYFSNGQSNAYTLHGVAVDSKGNRSERSETQVTVNGPALSTRHSTFTPVDSLLPADGKSQVTLTLTVRDEQQQPVDIALTDIQIAVKQSRAADLVVADPTRVSAGVYEVQVTAGTSEQSVTLTPSIQGTVLSEVRVSTTNIIPSPGKSAFSASPALIKADDKETATLTFSAKDENDNPVSGIAKSLVFDVVDSSGQPPAPGGITVSGIQEDGTTGVYSATLQGLQAGSFKLTPQVDGTPLSSLMALVELTALPPVATNSKFEAKPNKILADKKETSTLSFTAKDANDKPVSGIAKSLAFKIVNSRGEDPVALRLVTLGNITEDGTTGVYWATLSGTYSDTYTVTPQLDKADLSTLDIKVELTQIPLSEKNSQTSLLRANSLADGVHENTIRFTLRNIEGYNVGGRAKEISFRVTDAAGRPASDTQVSATESVSYHFLGMYEAKLTGTKQGTYYITPNINGAEWTSLKIPAILLTTGITSLDRTRRDYPHAFPVNSGFPTSAFQDAEFRVTLANNASPADYNWTSSASWLTHTGNGVFRFLNPPSDGSGIITITAARKGSTVLHRHTLAVKDWYYVSGNLTSSNWSTAMSRCDNMKYQRISRADATKGEGVNAVGSLSSEWAVITVSMQVARLWLSETNLMLTNIVDGQKPGHVVVDSTKTARTICRLGLK